MNVHNEYSIYSSHYCVFLFFFLLFQIYLLLHSLLPLTYYIPEVANRFHYPNQTGQEVVFLEPYVKKDSQAN